MDQDMPFDTAEDDQLFKSMKSSIKIENLKSLNHCDSPTQRDSNISNQTVIKCDVLGLKTMKSESIKESNEEEKKDYDL